MQTQVLARLGGASHLTAVPVPRRERLAVRAAAVSTKEVSAAASTSGEEIYIGFKKDEGARERERLGKGRVIRDDPRKYPGREDLGIFPSVVGGWAGGEAGLWKLRDEVLANKDTKSAAPAPASKPAPPPAGKDAIYVGFSKDELELRKSGAKGRVVYDDSAKYPGKEDIGPLPGATGGFAAGEVGVWQFVETGEVKVRGANEPGKRQFSPLPVAGLMILLGTGGSIVLDKVLNASQTLLGSGAPGAL